MVLFGQVAGTPVGSWSLEFAKSVGVPALIAVLVLTQLQPKIDHGIAIADHVDAELAYLAVRGCAPLPLSAPSASVGNFPTAMSVVP